MEVLIGFATIVLALVGLDIAALKWGTKPRFTDTNVVNDPRDNWHSRS